MPQPQDIINLLIQYRYLVLFPLAAIEGPIIALFAGFFVYLGYFQFVPAFLILILGDLIPDTIYYFIGRFGNKKRLIEKYSARSNLVSRNFNLIEKLWRDHGRKTMFFSKLAYGLSTPFLISAGLVNMPWKTFISYTLPITMIQYAAIMIIGFYLGHSYKLALSYIKDAGFFVAAALIIFVAGYIVLQRYAYRAIVKMEEEEK